MFLVGYHVIGGEAHQGLKVIEGNYREVNDVLAYIRMPLFTFLSGLVYAYRPFNTGFIGYTKGKFRRLLVPMLVVGTVFIATKSIVPGTNATSFDWRYLHIISVGHYWFIEALFTIFIGVAVLEKFAFLANKTKFSIVFILSCLLFLSGFEIRYFALNGVMYLLPFFLLGVATERFSLMTVIKPSLGYLLLIGVFISLYLILSDFITLQDKRSFDGLVIGSIFCCAILAINLKINVLAKIGVFSYTIYLYHVFFTAGTRIFLNKLGLTDINIVFVLSLLAGVFLPILVEHAFNKNNTTRLLFLGKSKIKLND
jgi:hypothetical protein